MGDIADWQIEQMMFAECEYCGCIVGVEGCECEECPHCKPDGNVHTVPNAGPEHVESKDCWCEPTLIGDFTEQGGVKAYLHREVQ